MANQPAEVTGKIVAESDYLKSARSFPAWLEQRAASEDYSEFSEEQVGKILMYGPGAAELDDVPSGAAMIGIEMRIFSFTVHKGQSKFEKTRYKHFMVVKYASLETGEEGVFTCGGEAVMPSLKYKEDHGELPWDCIMQEVATGNGTLLKLRDIPKRAVQGSRES
jgi:hypothetical protein